MASLFQKIGKGLANAAKFVGQKVLKPALNTVSAVASVIPGVGTIVGAAAGIVADLIPGETQAAIVNAVDRDQVVKVEKIEETIAAANPGISTPDLVKGAKAMTEVAQTLVPTATVSDEKAITSISFSDKLKAFYGKYKKWIFGGVGAILLTVLFFVFGRNRKNGRRR